MEKKIRMTTMSQDFADKLATTINMWISSFSKYIVENYDELKDVNEEDMTERLRKVLDLPKPTSGTGGLMGIAPNLTTVSTPKDGAVKRTRATKKPTEDLSLWITIDEYSAKTKEGEKLCAYYSNRLTDEKKKQKVCCAPVSDTSNADHLEWRCDAHKGSTSNIKKVINVKGPLQGIDKTQAIPGVTIPAIGVPPPLPVGLGTIMGGTAPIPPLPPMPNMLPKPSLTPPRIPNLPGMPPLPSLPPKIEAPKIPSPVKVPSPVPEPPKVVKQPSLARVAGMSEKHLIAQDEELKGMLLELDTSSGSAVIFTIGKFNGETPNPAPSNYLDLIVPLDQTEKSNASMYSIGYRQYVKPMSIPVIPGLPTIPTLP
jgi:hypothetical protein